MLKRIVSILLLSVMCWLSVEPVAHAQLMVTPTLRRTVANTWTALQTFTASPGIDLNGTAPSMTLTDTTASAKSLTIAVDANLADFRESAGATGSLLQLDLANSTARLPTLIGGTGTTSTLSLQSTAGVGATGADIIFKVGNNGATEAGRILNSGVAVLALTKSFTKTADLLTLSDTVDGYTNVTAYAFRDTNASTLIGGSPFGGTGVVLGPTSRITWSSSTVVSGILDTILARPSAGNLELSASGTTGSFALVGNNGQKYTQGRVTELITVASGVLTQASTVQIPADAILKAAEIRVTVQPGGTATMVATATTSATILQQGANMSTAAGTTDVGTRAWGTNYVGVAAQTVTFTFNGVTSDALGRIRLDLYYEVPTAPTS